MKHLFSSIGLFVLLAVASLLQAAPAEKPRLPAGGDKPKPAEKARSQPTEKTAEPVEGRKTLGNAVTFAVPQDWLPAKNAMTALRAAYVSPDRAAMMSIEVLPASMRIEPTLAPAMMKKMSENRQANKQKFVQQPALEEDNRFVIRIRERYEVKDKIADQLHLYRQVGPRFVLVTVNSLGGEEKAKEHQAVAIEAIMSASFIQK